MIRCFDIILSILGLVILSPLLVLITLWILLDSGVPVIYRQERIGLLGKPFSLIKFRTMHVRTDKGCLLTIGSRDKRITRSGYFLRKYKLDEVPQLLNVLMNDMSMVGPRPEVRKYVEMYTQEQRAVLKVKPGITDYASIYYKDENQILALANDPEKEYITQIMPHKLRLNLEYSESMSLFNYLKIIFKTIISITR